MESTTILPLVLPSDINKNLTKATKAKIKRLEEECESKMWTMEEITSSACYEWRINLEKYWFNKTANIADGKIHFSICCGAGFEVWHLPTGKRKPRKYLFIMAPSNCEEVFYGKFFEEIAEILKNAGIKAYVNYGIEV
jgi:hypothetical protein